MLIRRGSVEVWITRSAIMAEEGGIDYGGGGAGQGSLNCRILVTKRWSTTLKDV